MSSCTIRTGQHYRLRAVEAEEDCLITVLSGEKRIHTPYRMQSVMAGQAVVFARGCVVDIENIPTPQGAYLAKIMSFSDASISLFSNNEARVSSPNYVEGFEKLVFDPSLAESFDHAFKALNGQETLSESIREHRAQEVLLALSGRGFEFAADLPMSWATRVRRLVRERPAENWNSKHVARAFHLSPSSLQRRLVGECKSLAACVREARLEMAMGLLQTTRKAVYEIAQSCGYSSSSKFSAAFRKRYGVQPTQLR